MCQTPFVFIFKMLKKNEFIFMKFHQTATDKESSKWVFQDCIVGLFNAIL